MEELPVERPTKIELVINLRTAKATGTYPGLFTVTAIERRVLQSEGNRPVAWSGLQTNLWSGRLGKMPAAKPSTKHGIEAFVSMPSLFQACPER